MATSDSAFTGSIPNLYDQFLGPLLFEPYAEDLAKRIPVKNILSALELACGTGRLTRQLRSSLPKSVRLVATDLNPDMIEIAREKVKGNIEWQVEDAQVLPFPDDSFDLVTCQFGIMFFPDKPKALKEVWRVLKPGGCFLFNTWDKIENNSAAHIVNQVIHSFWKEDAPTFYQTPFSMFNMQELGMMLEKSKFSNAELNMLKKIGIIDSADGAARGFLEGNPIYNSIREKDAGLLPKIHQAVTEEFTRKFGDHPMKAPMQAWIGKAWKLSS